MWIPQERSIEEEQRLWVEREGPLGVGDGCTLKIGSRSDRGSFGLLRIHTA